MARRWAILLGMAAAGVVALGAQPVDSDPPDLKLSGPKKQNPTIPPGTHCNGPPIHHPNPICGHCDRDICAVKLFAHCGDEACTVSARGRVTRFNDKLLPPHFGPVDVKPGEKGYVSLELPKKTRKKAGEAIAEGRKVKAIVTVKATDAAGNVATAKRTIKIVKDGCTVCQPPF